VIQFLRYNENDLFKFTTVGDFLVSWSFV